MSNLGLTVDDELDLVGGHGPDAVAGGADVGAGVVLLHVGDAEHRALGIGGQARGDVAVLEKKKEGGRKWRDGAE